MSQDAPRPRQIVTDREYYDETGRLIHVRGYDWNGNGHDNRVLIYYPEEDEFYSWITPAAVLIDRDDDGVLDEAFFFDLKVHWLDRNGDGKAQEDELESYPNWTWVSYSPPLCG